MASPTLPSGKDWPITGRFKGSKAPALAHTAQNKRVMGHRRLGLAAGASG